MAMRIIVVSDQMALLEKLRAAAAECAAAWEIEPCVPGMERSFLASRAAEVVLLDDAGVCIEADLLDALRRIQPEAQLFVVTNADMRALQAHLECGADAALFADCAPRELAARLLAVGTARRCELELREVNESYSQLKAMQIQLVQAEKLAGIGRLAAGIAHEINNPLGFVAGNVEVLEKYINRYEIILDKVKNAGVFTDEACVETCREIAQFWKAKRLSRIRNDMRSLFDDTKEGLVRISNIVTGLKNFSRINQQGEKGIFDRNEGIKTTLIVARNELKYNCEVEFQEGDIPAIYVNGGQMNQVILNMLINAAHAIKEKFANEKGQITIATYQEAEFVCCSIKDNGCGMAQETLQHVFEPFFTTKAVGVGTGLGLGIAYDIVFVKHGGRIDVTSEVGEGTEFVIRLPKQSAADENQEEKI